MKTKKITLILLGLTVVILGGWDIYVANTPQTGDTISEILLSAAHSYPAIPFLFGALMGHLFWPQYEEK